MRGLKFFRANSEGSIRQVAPYTGAWIEIYLADWDKIVENVAPYTGAWIEILSKSL